MSDATGSLSVLTTGDGDMNLSFDETNSAEVDKAIKMLQTMQRKGYAIVLQLEDGRNVRVDRIDPETKEYVYQLEHRAPARSVTLEEIAEPPAEQRETFAKGQENDSDESGMEGFSAATAPTEKPRRGRPKKTREARTPIARGRASAIPRSAGG
jgi:hypothetical protein